MWGFCEAYNNIYGRRVEKENRCKQKCLITYNKSSIDLLRCIRQCMNNYVKP